MLVYKCVLFLSYFILVCQGNEYWVRPNTTVDCPTDVPTQRCVTLLDIAANNSRYFISNTQINFLAGIHYVQSEKRLEIGVNRQVFRQVSNISLVGDYRAKTTINCNDTQVGFAFYRIDNFVLANIAIVCCSCCHDIGLIESEMNVSMFLLVSLLGGVTVIQNVVIQNSTGTGLMMIDGAERNVTILGCTFAGNNVGANAYGNVYINTGSEHITVSNCTFADGLVTHGGSQATVAAGLTIIIAEDMYFYDLPTYEDYDPIDRSAFNNIIIEKSTFNNNKAPSNTAHLHLQLAVKSAGMLSISTSNFTSATSSDSGSVHINVGARENPTASGHTMYDITLTKCMVINNTGGGLKVVSNPNSLLTMLIHNNIFRANIAQDGAAICIKAFGSGRNYNSTIKGNLFIDNKASNRGGAIYIINSQKYYHSATTIVDCEFTGNAAKQGSAISYKSTLPDMCKIQLQGYKGNAVISTCNFTKHTAHQKQLAGSVIHLSSTQLDIKDTKVIDNNCRGIHLNMSTLNIKGNVWITQNKAQYGAGIMFDHYPCCTQTSHIYMVCGSHLHIKNNSATDYGGGLMVKSGCAVPKMCFAQAQDKQCGTVKIHMSGNTAGIAGTAIYGGDLESCFFKPFKNTHTSEVFWAIFNITERYSGPSVVASQPYKVCICNENFSTDHSCVFHHNVQVFTGQVFTVSAVGVGQYNYSSPAVIRAIAPQGVKLGEHQVTPDTNLLCTNLTFSLQTLLKSVTIKLQIETQFSSMLTIQPQPALLSINILDCPLGFQLIKTLKVCDCLPHLTAKGITCNITKQTLHKSPSMWIGNFSDEFVAHKNCPFDYCDPSVQDFRLTSQDDQCNWNRTGILCGACRYGYSIVFGTSKCQECSNVYLLLLLPLSLAGIGLVVLLLKCNLTVSTGTLNGLIFYANIVQVNRKMFFSSYPPGPMSTLSYVLSVFIAWINLDLGIEVCFAENLNTFSQTWLQFLFPVYIWCIIGLLIIVCRYSTTASRLTGSNTVSVLATLFLLSYAKLLRTTLNIFSPITITDPNNTIHHRWILDANYGFLHWPHLTLFLAALFTLVLHLIPFTALLLFGPTLQAHTNYRLLSWVTRIKPFLDAYHGPYKSKHRYWTGFMLLVRMLLLTVFACNALGDPNINLLTIVVTVLTVLIAWIKIGRFYRKWPINILEVFYLLNLEIMAVATLYLNRASSSSDTQQQTLSLITVGSALLAFIAVIIYHCCTALTETRRGRKLKQKIIQMYQNRAATQEEDEVVQPQVRASSPTRTEVNLRELLLEEKN